MNDCKSYGIPLSEVCGHHFYISVRKLTEFITRAFTSKNKHLICVYVDSNALFTTTLNVIGSLLEWVFGHSIAYDLIHFIYMYKMANPLVFHSLTLFFLCEQPSNWFLCLIFLSFFLFVCLFVVLRFKYYIIFFFRVYFQKRFAKKT